MTTENLTTFTEVDPNNRFTVTATKVDVSALERAEDAYVYDDKGVAHFNDDFEQLHDIYVNSISANDSIFHSWILANDIDEWQGLVDGSKDAFTIQLFKVAAGGGAWINMKESDGGTEYNDIWTGGSDDTIYYLKIRRDEAVGTYGTLYCDIYTNAERTTLVDTLVITLHSSKKDFRYYYAASSVNDGGGQGFTGYSQNHDLQEVAGVGTLVNGGLINSGLIGGRLCG